MDAIFAVKGFVVHSEIVLDGVDVVRIKAFVAMPVTLVSVEMEVSGRLVADVEEMDVTVVRPLRQEVSVRTTIVMAIRAVVRVGS